MSAASDRRVLQALYAVTRGKKWNRKRGWMSWMSVAPLSGWEGVVIDNTGHVTSLFLAFNNLRGITTPLLLYDGDMTAGNIPAELCQLSSLQMLNLYDNNLSGKSYDAICWY